jgi:hypothetical protein
VVAQNNDARAQRALGGRDARLHLGVRQAQIRIGSGWRSANRVALELRQHLVFGSTAINSVVSRDI